MREKLFDQICAEIAEGETARQVCKKHKISRSNLYTFLLGASDEKKDQYARALLCGAEIMADDLIDIADRSSDPRKAQVKIDVRKWLLSKRYPKKYGDKLDLNANVNATTKVIRLPAKSQEGAPIE